MDFEGNLQRIKESIEIAKKQGARYRVRVKCMEVTCQLSILLRHTGEQQRAWQNGVPFHR